MHELVVGRTEQLVACLVAEAGAIDERLRMLDAEADRKRLRFDVDAACLQHIERIAGAVADREHDVVRTDMLAIVEDDPAHPLAAVPVRSEVEIRDPAFETIFAAERLDRRAQALDHGDEPEGADMRLADVQDLGRRARAHELLQHLAAMVGRVPDAAPELAVGKRARPALAELHVRFRVQHAAPPEPPGIAGSFPHRAAAFENDRPEAALRQDQGRHQAARAGADHDWACGDLAVRASHGLVTRVGRRADRAVPFRPAQKGRLIAHFSVQRVNQQDRRPAACVVAAACNDHG